MLEVGEVVKLMVDRPDEGVCRGDIGVVVFCFATPREAYEVEFLDEDGYTKTVVTLEANDLSVP